MRVIVPKLRFKEFKNKWKQYNLEECTELIKDGTHGSHPNIDNGIPLLSAKDIYDNKIHIPIDSRKISNDEYNKIYKNYSLEMNDILMTIVGTIGRTAIYKNEKVAFQRSVATIRCKKNFYYFFIVYLLDSKKVLNQIQNATNFSAQGGIYLRSIEKLICYIPSIEEQEKIGNLFELLDKKIELQKQKIEVLKLYKKGLSQKIFNKNVINKWNEKCLNDLLKEGSKNPVENTKNYQKITIKLNLQGVVKSIINRDMSDTRPFYIRKANELIIGKQNYFNGSIAIVPEELDNTICSNAIMSFSIKTKDSIKFIYNYISQSNYMKKREYLANGTGQKELSEKEFLKFYIKIPSIEEQNKLISYLDLIDKKLFLNFNNLKNLEKYKKALLQQMFI